MSNVPTKPEKLTARQLEVLTLIAEGRSNREIAEELHISLWTARNHVQHILDKLGLTNRTQAAAYAHRMGIIAKERHLSQDRRVDVNYN